MSTLKTNTLSNTAGTLTVPTDTVVQGTAKAWVNFNGTGTVAIRAAFNVSSITDLTTGRYTINFNTALPDTNYCVVANTSNNSGSWIESPQLFESDGGYSPNAPSTTSFSIGTLGSGFASWQDPDYICITVHR